MEPSKDAKLKAERRSKEEEEEKELHHLPLPLLLRPMTRRRRSISPSPRRCLPHIACFRNSTHLQQEEKEEDAEGHRTEDNPLSRRSRRRWFSSQCRRIALELTLLLSSTSTETNPPRETSSGVTNVSPLRRRRALVTDPDHHRSWLLEPNCSITSDVEVSGESPMEPNIATSTATVLLVNLEEDEEDVTSSSSSPSSPSWHRKEPPLLVFKWRRRCECLEKAVSPVAGALVRFGFAEIRSATKGFCRGRVLGRGALSCVFRGRLKLLAVAVKRLEGPETECAKAFCRELSIAGALRNQNVVPLVGYCIDREGLFLVYKYVSGGSLDRRLYIGEKNGDSDSAEGCGTLSWSGRLKVALGTARAVEYLHFGTDKCVIHRDIKPSNILLSSNNVPKLCDFGLATWTRGPSLPALRKTVKGTFGYLAPEYFQHGKLSDKTDVYAFGVLLLELISGRKAIDTCRPQGDENLVIWARPLLKQGERSLKDLIDPRLIRGNYNQLEMNHMVLAATACLDADDSSRPSIREVIQILQGDEGNTNSCSNLAGNCYSAGYGFQWEELSTESDIKSHLALAMLGVSDSEDGGVYSN